MVRWCRIVSGWDVVGERNGGGNWGGLGWGGCWDFRVSVVLRGMGLWVPGNVVEGEV